MRKLSNVLLSLFVSLAAVGYLIAVWYWDSAPLGFQIVSGLAGWVSLFWVITFVVAEFSEWKADRAKRPS